MSTRTKLLFTLCGLVSACAVTLSLAPFDSQDVGCDSPVFMAFQKVQMPKPGGGLQAVDGICGHDARIRLAFGGALGAVGLLGGVTVWIAYRRNG